MLAITFTIFLSWLIYSNEQNDLCCLYMQTFINRTTHIHTKKSYNIYVQESTHTLSPHLCVQNKNTKLNKQKKKNFLHTHLNLLAVVLHL